MKKILFVLFLLFLSISIFGQVIIVKDSIVKDGSSYYTKLRLYDDGTTHIIAEFKDTVRHGKYIEQSGDGDVWLECYYIDGKLDGLLREYRVKNGKLLRTCNFKEGLANGEEVWYYNNGNITRITCYNMGVMISKKVYKRNGKLWYNIEEYHY